MKILVLESSGNKHGSSNLLAEAFICGAKENGHEVTESDTMTTRANRCLSFGDPGGSTIEIHE